MRNCLPTLLDKCNKLFKAPQHREAYVTLKYSKRQGFIFNYITGNDWVISVQGNSIKELLENVEAKSAFAEQKAQQNNLELPSTKIV